MAIHLHLRPIDHRRQVERASEVLASARETGDDGELRRLVLDLPKERSKALVNELRLRIAKLRELAAPAVILESEEGRLGALELSDEEREATIRGESFGALRERLAQWGWESATRLEAWRELGWYLAVPEPDAPGAAWVPEDRTQDLERWRTHLDRDWLLAAFHGTERCPRAFDGRSLLGDLRLDDATYNPPEVVTILADRLASVGSDDWDDRCAERESLLSAQLRPGLPPLDAASVARAELDDARADLAALQESYRNAAQQGFGLYLQYS